MCKTIKKIKNKKVLIDFVICVHDILNERYLQFILRSMLINKYCGLRHAHNDFFFLKRITVNKSVELTI